MMAWTELEIIRSRTLQVMGWSGKDKEEEIAEVSKCDEMKQGLRIGEIAGRMLIRRAKGDGYICPGSKESKREEGAKEQNVTDLSKRTWHCKNSEPEM